MMRARFELKLYLMYFYGMKTIFNSCNINMQENKKWKCFGPNGGLDPLPGQKETETLPNAPGRLT